MVFPEAPASKRTLPELCVNMPVPDISQLPPAVKDVSSNTAGADKVPDDTVTLPPMSRSQAVSLASRVPPFTRRFPVRVRLFVEVSNVPFVTVRSLPTVIAPSNV